LNGFAPETIAQDYPELGLETHGSLISERLFRIATAE
jgi:hypothetical protein